MLYFSGLPVNKQFGILTVDTGYSFAPTNGQYGLFPTKIRGGYPGTHAFIHQARKLGLKL